jgi:hypothetical protein
MVVEYQYCVPSGVDVRGVVKISRSFGSRTQQTHCAFLRDMRRVLNLFPKRTWDMRAVAFLYEYEYESSAVRLDISCSCSAYKL